jgi:GTP pyrophosphokinase
MPSLTTKYKEKKMNKELFFSALANLSKEDILTVRDAYTCAKEAHRTQKRVGGERYFEHPRAVAWIIVRELGILNDQRIVCAALLHDVIEDTPFLSFNTAKDRFGEDIASWVIALTKIPESNQSEWEQYLENIAHAPWQVILIKLCDRLHNLRTANVLPANRRDGCIADTEKYFFGLVERFCETAPENMRPIARKIESALRTEISLLISED